MKTVTIGPVEFDGTQINLIAGPCVIEGRDHALKMASAIKQITEKTGIPLMQKLEYPVLFDATHRAQLPGGSSSSAGMREMIPNLAKAAVAAGCNGLFMEVHDNVDEAKSDATTQWSLDQLELLLAQCKMIYDVIQ